MCKENTLIRAVKAKIIYGFKYRLKHPSPGRFA
jgi:hypothetical protein